MIGKLLCWLGVHDHVRGEPFPPKYGNVVIEVRCARCLHLLENRHIPTE